MARHRATGKTRAGGRAGPGVARSGLRVDAGIKRWSACVPATDTRARMRGRTRSRVGRRSARLPGRTSKTSDVCLPRLFFLFLSRSRSRVQRPGGSTWRSCLLTGERSRASGGLRWVRSRDPSVACASERGSASGSKRVLVISQRTTKLSTLKLCQKIALREKFRASRPVRRNLGCTIRPVGIFLLANLFHSEAVSLVRVDKSSISKLRSKLDSRVTV